MGHLNRQSPHPFQLVREIPGAEHLKILFLLICLNYKSITHLGLLCFIYYQVHTVQSMPICIHRVAKHYKCPLKT